MVTNGKSLNMRSIVQQLEQHVQCWSLECEFQQQSDELQQQYRFPVLTTVSPHIFLFENSGATGRVFPAFSEINRNLLFSKATKNQEVSTF